MGKATRRTQPPRLPDRTELLLERRDKPRAGHPADYASLSRYLPPQKIYSPPPPSPPPPVLAIVGRRRARRHGGTARSGPQLSINRVPEPLSFPEQSCTLVLGRVSAGRTRTRETNIIRDGGESIRDRRRRLRAILMGHAETPPRARIVLKRFPGPRARGITLGKRVVMVEAAAEAEARSLVLSLSHPLSERVCVCIARFDQLSPLDAT